MLSVCPAKLVFGGLIGKGSQSVSQVLLIGQTQGEKNRAARAMHFTGWRRGKALVLVESGTNTYSGRVKVHWP